MQEISEHSVRFSGSLTVGSISDVHTLLADAMAREEHVVVDLDEVVEADLTLAQLLESARRTAAQEGRGLRLSKPADGAVLQVLQRGGFLDPADADRMNFWLGKQTKS